jgi:hypothetical protein
MATGGEGAQARTMGHGASQSFYLHDLEEQGVSFYSLLMKKMIHWGLAATAWSSWSSTAVHDLDWASLASRSSSKSFTSIPSSFTLVQLLWMAANRTHVVANFMR